MDGVELATCASKLINQQFAEIVRCCDRSRTGKRLPGALYVHVSALPALERSLQDYENLARQHLKKLEGVTLVKFSTDQPRVSYLSYPNFDTDPHPALFTSMEIDLRDLHVHYRDYDSNDNPPLLHQKDSMVTADYPLYEKFAKLTRQEEGWGLLEDLRLIYDTRGWQKCLEEHCAELKGHRVVWRKDADPCKVKLVRSNIRTRQRE